ncbi:MAG: porin family protein [Muribaculaceae bacterium]|nr:porin family protein [Muribaculaceae bacterium]
MTRLKRIILASIILVTFSSVLLNSSAAVKGEKSVGIQLGYTSYNESAVAGIGFSYTFSSHFRFAPNLQYAFRNNNRDGLLINFDCHIPLKIESGEKVEVYPIAGINYSCWTRYYSDEEKAQSNDVSKRKNRFGLNAGAGVGYNVTGALRLTFEARYSLVKHYDTTTLALGIGYRF